MTISIHLPMMITWTKHPRGSSRYLNLCWITAHAGYFCVASDSPWSEVNALHDWARLRFGLAAIMQGLDNDINAWSISPTWLVKYLNWSSRILLSNTRRASNACRIPLKLRGEHIASFRKRKKTENTWIYVHHRSLTAANRSKDEKRP